MMSKAGVGVNAGPSFLLAKLSHCGSSAGASLLPHQPALCHAVILPIVIAGAALAQETGLGYQ
jgi:hypothetical protein